MKNIFKDISASTLQVILNQALGLFIFLAISRNLDKGVYGELNWSMAILTFSTAILSFRLEQIVVRKVAAGDDAQKNAGALFGAYHVLRSTVLSPPFSSKHAFSLFF